MSFPPPGFQMKWAVRLSTVALLILCLFGTPVLGQVQPPADPAVVGAEAATQAYLDTVPPEKKARSDAYFEGGYWIILWGFLWSSAAFLLLLHSGWSARLRNASARITRFVWLQPALYWVGFVLITTVLTFPFAAYTGFWREHQYGLATQTFGPWLGDQLKATGLEIVFGSILVVVFYAVLRTTGRSWWLWGAAVTIAFTTLMVMIGPVYLAPIFNTYEPLRNSDVRESILRMAHANGIRADDVWEMDASKQTTRISANVSGMLGTERITLNDNLLNRASPAAVEAVMGHEIGHYVLNHTYEMLAYLAVIIAGGFALIGWAFDGLSARYRSRWNVSGITDPAGLPLIALLFGAYMFVLTPVMNTIVRTNEYEADIFGLNAAKQPDGFAEALLGEYRKLDPSPLEEAIFFDHPSGRTRILAAMRWKEHAGAPSR